MLRVTADTNIFISGIVFSGGKPFQVLELARAGKIKLNVSDAILDEMENVLKRKFNFTPEQIGESRQRVRSMARVVKPVVELDVIQEDPADNRILECAVAACSDVIVTGDNDLLRLGTYDSIRMVRPTEFLEVVRIQALEIQRRG